MDRKSPQKIGFPKADGLKGFVDVYGAKHDDWGEDFCCWARSREGSKDIVTRFDSLSRLFKITLLLSQSLLLRHIQGRGAGQGTGSSGRIAQLVRARR